MEERKIHPSDDLLITIKPEATPEEEERFLAELARVMLAVAKHVVALEEAQSGQGDGEEVIEF